MTSAIYKIGYVSTLFLVTKVEAGNTDLCPNYNFPRLVGESDAATLNSCFIALPSGGYFQAGSTLSTLLAGTDGGTAFMMTYDSSMDIVENYMLNPAF
jgi:hypothetical protein